MGGVLGGIIAFILIAVTIFAVLTKNRRKKRAAIKAQQFEEYTKKVKLASFSHFHGF